MGEHIEMSLTQTMPIMINQTVAMFLMMAVGIVLFKTKRLDNQGAAQMANVALYVASPAITITAFATTFDAEKLVAGGLCMLLTVLFTLGSATIGWLVYRDRQRISQMGIMISNMGFMGIPLVQAVLGEEYVFYVSGSATIGWLVYRDRQRISQMGIMISNMGFMGIPLVQAVLGEEYVFYVSACIAAQIPITFTYGIWLISQDKSEVSPKRILSNPAIIAVFVGVALFFASIELDGIAKATASGLSGLNTGLAMIVLGSYLAQADLRGILRNKNLYLTHFIRLVVVPLIIVAILWVMPLSTPIKLTLLIAFAAPSGTVTAIFPQMFNKDYRFGAGLVSSSTLLSLLTMPIMLSIGLMVF